MTTPLTDKQVDQLIADYLAGSLREAHRAVFEDWLRASPDNARRVARLAATDFALREVCQDTKADYLLDVLNQIDAAAGPAELVTLHQINSPRPNFMLYAIAGAMAAVLVLAVTLTFVLSGNSSTESIATKPVESSDPSEPSRDGPAHNQASPIRFVATITAERDAVWSSPQAEGASEPGSAPQVGTALAQGQRLTLTQGFAEITTKRGAITILEAPATVELLGDNALRLESGKLTGLCHTASSKGFLVRTRFGDVTDLGTEFGVRVTPQRSEVTVFVGEVRLDTPDGTTQPVTHNQTAHVTIENDEPALVVEDGVIDGIVRRIPQEPLVTAAYINDDRFTVQVAHQSLFEDAKIHTDRNHEINGVDATGLPPELLGADIVLTPADARLNTALGPETLQIEIETSQPAQVYLLFTGDDDVPAWIARDYVKTNLHAGIDFAKSKVIPHASLGVGPGQSIGAKQDIWRRKQPVDGRALVGENMLEHSAYIIVAVPIPSSLSSPSSLK